MQVANEANALLGHETESANPCFTYLWCRRSIAGDLPCISDARCLETLLINLV